MIEFMRVTQTRAVTTSIQVPDGGAGVLEVHDRVLAARVTQYAVEWAVATRMRMRRLACSMTAKT
ncbi:hypothetical protein AB0D57_13475 [Streptomyces sp. NPDC048275]|uniref:hypothetical protein n=1 Tax=Streptomyces sp. NPDC048275 TaxID=3155629 RepID=UPI0033EEFECB